MRLLLEHRGHKVIECGSAEEFFKALRDGAAPDVAILDLNLGEESGIDLLRRLRKDPLFSPLPALFASAQPDRVSVSDAVGLGIVGFLAKPVDSSRLLQAVNSAIAKRWMCAHFRDVQELCLERGIERTSYLAMTKWFFSELTNLVSDRASTTTTAAALHVAASDLGLRIFVPALEEWQRSNDSAAIPEVLRRVRDAECLFNVYLAPRGT